MHTVSLAYRAQKKTAFQRGSVCKKVFCVQKKKFSVQKKKKFSVQKYVQRAKKKAPCAQQETIKVVCRCACADDFHVKMIKNKKINQFIKKIVIMYCNALC